MKRLLLAAWLITGLCACEPSDPCDPGYKEVHGACFPIDGEEDASEPGDAEDGDDEDGGSLMSDAEVEPPGDPYEGFGDECADEGDCPEGLICGAPQLPMCTQVNCLDEPSICPPDWTCVDTAGASPDPSVTSICLKI
jgi:hypothetical protein